LAELDALVGQDVTIAGRVIGAASFSNGFKFELDDGSGCVTLLLWHDVYDDCRDVPGLNLGAQVEASGIVGSYEGALQIEPRWGSAITVIEPATAWAEPRQIVTLSNADVGQRVMIEGTVVRIGGFQSAVEVYVGDETGEFKVFIWRSVLDRIPNNTALGTPGSHVRVVGTVTQYRDALELVPTLPYDVIVIQIAD
jgi:DNA/RNA endonuclease YhcR with UshA esterase domain